MVAGGGIWRGMLLVAPATLVFAALFVLPQVDLVGTSFGRPRAWTTAVYARFFSDPYNLRLLGRSLGLAAAVTTLTMLLGVPLAYLLARLQSRWVPALLMLVTFPLWVSALVRSFAWMVLFVRDGMISEAIRATGLVAANYQVMFTFAGIVVAMAQVLLPVMVITLFTVIRGIDRDLEAAAMNLGASPLAALFLVTLRLARGGLVAGGLLVFSLAMSAFATPSLIGGASAQLMSVAIYEQTLEVLDWPFAAAMSTILLAVAVIVALVNGRLAGRRVAVHP